MVGEPKVAYIMEALKLLRWKEVVLLLPSMLSWFGLSSGWLLAL